MRWLCVSLLSVAVACSGDTKGSTKTSSESSNALSKASRCDAIVEKAGQQAVLMMGAMAGALGEPSDAPGAMAEARTEMRGELRALHDQCLEWPERTLKCFDEPVFMALNSDECEQAVAVAMGQTVPLEDVPPGPEPTWRYTFPAKPDPLLVRDDGWVFARTVAVDEDYKSTYRLTAVRDGKKLWEVEAPASKQILDLGERGIAVLVEGRLEILDAESGTTKASVRPDGKGLPEFDPEYDSQPYLAVVAVDGETLWVGDTEARFYRIDDAKPEFVGALSEESLDSGARLWVFGDERWLWEDYDLRRFDTHWKPLASMRAHDFMGHVEVGSDHALLVVDGEVVQLDPKACEASQTFAVSNWPHPGDLVFADGDECADCGRAPKGCVAWSSHLSEVSNSPVGRLPDGGVVVSDGEKTVGLRGGASLWSAGTGAAGPAVVAGDVFVYSVEEERTRLWSLDVNTGAPRWATVLPGDGGLLYNTDEINLVAAGSWVVGGYKADIVALQR